MLGYEIATGNGSIVGRCVWQGTIVNGYDIAIIAGGRVKESFVMEPNPSQTIVCRKVLLLNKRCTY